MASKDPLPKVTDFLSLCEKCHRMVGDLWLINGEYVCDDCYMQTKPIKETYNFKKIELRVGMDSVQKNIYGWTKWYGANNNLFVLTTEWYCQACNEKQTNELPSYLIRIENQEYGRICSVCLHTALQRHINNIFDLMSVVKPCHPDF